MIDVTFFPGYLKSISLSLCLFCVPLLLAAEEDIYFSELSEHDFLADMPVVLSATRLSQPLSDVPVAMTVIDRETIDAIGATSIPDVLRLVPGFQVGRITGSKTTVTYHGISDRYARNLQVMVDGRSVYDAGFGGVVWADLPILIEDIQRIEVIRGPNSAAFGANAFNATINIITAHPAEQSGTLLRVTAGSLDTKRLMSRHAASVGDFDFRVTVMGEQSSGLESRYDDSQTGMVSFRGDYRMGAKSELLIEAGISDGERDDGLGSSFDDPEFDLYQPERTIDNYQEFQQLRWSLLQSAESEWSLQFYHNYQEIEDEFETLRFSDYLTYESLKLGGPPVPPAAVPGLLGWEDQRLKLGYDDINSERFDLELQHTLRLNPDWRLVWGGGTRRDSAWSYARFGKNSEVKRSQARVFGNAEWHATEDLVVNAGLMAEAYEGYKPYYSPRLALNFHVDKQQTFRVSYSKAIRMPTLVENHSYLRSRFQDESVFDAISLSKGRLKPEEIESVELGYVGFVPSLEMTLDAKLYRDEIRGFIGHPWHVECQDPVAMCTHPVVGSTLQGAWYYENAGDATTSGYEFGLTAKPFDRTLLRASYAYAKTRGDLVRRINLSPTIPYTYTQFSNLTPQNTFSLLVAYEFQQQISASMAYYRLDGFEWFGDGEPVPGYDKVDAKLSHTGRYAGAEGRLSLIVKNIGGHYTDFRSANKIGPEAYIDFELFFD